MSAELVQLPPRVGDVPGMLRKLADQIEAGEVTTDRLALVIDVPSGLDVRGFGDCDLFASIALLSGGQQKLVRMLNEES